MPSNQTKEWHVKPKTIILAVLGVAVLGVLIAVLMRPASGGGIENVDAAGVEKAMAAGAQAVDVRTAGEFQMGHIPGAINVPVDQVETSAASWDREATYVVYCATGSRSVGAVETMKAMGFKNIKHFAAGIQAWTGQLQTGGAASGSGKIETSGKPVFIEFYTDS